MPSRFPTSSALFASAILLAAPNLHAQTIPPATPTTAPTPAPQPAPPPAHRAQIAFADNLLTITADNSSLNQILRDVSQTTGMTITGGVADERVFGTYGPADPSTILAALLDGTGSNMLLIQNTNHTPRELILTPRHGGATPPSPNAYHDANERDLPPQQMRRFPNTPQEPPPPPPPPQPPTQPEPTPAVAPTPTPDTSTNTTTEQSPNGVKTPQQIYEELMKMQQPKTPPPQ